MQGFYGSSSGFGLSLFRHKMPPVINQLKIALPQYPVGTCFPEALNQRSVLIIPQIEKIIPPHKLFSKILL